MLKKMRQCRLNFADNRYDCEAGIIGEHYATELIVTPPAIMPTEAVYRLCFEPGGLSEIILQTTDGAFSYPLPSAVTATSCCCVTLIGYVGSEQVYKSRMVRLRFSQTAGGDNSIDLQQPGIVDEVNQNTAARHTHENKAVLDKFAESKDGKPTYDGKALGGGGASDFTIKMAVASGEDGYTVTSCDATVEQIDAAVAAEKRVVLIATDTASGLFWEMPIIFGSQGDSYEFGTFLEGQVIVSFVDKVGENESKWQFMLTKIAAEAVDYSNAALPYVSTVGEALDKLVPNSHTHANKGTLDKLSDVNGKLQYNGSDVGLKGEKGDTGASGASGSPGTDGITPRIGTNGNWYLGDTDTGKPSRGEKGDPGKDGTDGSPGAAGADGVTPAIGENGNWFVGNTDTGKPSRGATGAKGSDGANGKNGAQGEKGADGKTPVRGTDYWTAADKQEIVNSVIAALPDGTEVSY